MSFFFRRRSQPDESLRQFRQHLFTFEQLPEVANAPWNKKSTEVNTEVDEESDKSKSSSTATTTTTETATVTATAAKPVTKHHWAKGTGYGNASRETTTTWDINTWISNRNANLQKTREACVNLHHALEQVAAKGFMEQIASEQKFNLLLYFLRDELRVDSISEIERHSIKYEMALKLLELISSHDATAAALLTTEQLPLYENISLLATQAEMIQRLEKTLESKIGVVTAAPAAVSKKKAAVTTTPAVNKKADDDNSFSLVVQRIITMSNKLKELKAKIQVHQEELLKSGDENTIDHKSDHDHNGPIVNGEAKQVEPQNQIQTQTQVQDSAIVITSTTPSITEVKVAQTSSTQDAALANLQNKNADTTTITTTTTTTTTATAAEVSSIPQTSPVLMTQNAVVATLPAGVPLPPPVPAGELKELLGLTSSTTTSTPTPTPTPAAIKIVAWSPEEKKLQLEKDDQYVKEMKSMMFGEVTGFNYHKYSANNVIVTRPWIKRITAEYADLNRSLPLTACSSVFMRVHEEKMGMLQFMVAAPEDTPYAGGLFLFDVFLPTEYPNKPPLCNLQTTGKGSVRFNPNLYNCGKVCLSLLGTWNGDQSESWNAQTSTLLQLAVSIQSLIFVPEPYFNEPGYERQMGTDSGRNSSDTYNRNIEQATVRWAMLDMIKNPPKGFEQIVKKHFTLRRDAILQECGKWLVKPQREQLNTLVQELKVELDKLEQQS